MDAEKLRTTYNQYFQTSKSSWSSKDFTKTRKVARQTKQWLTEFGFMKKSVNFLDVGCATGYYTESFGRLGWNATGLDYSEVAVESARDEFPNCQFLQMNGFEPHFTNSFDVIFCRGFSGVNTHDLDFIATWINKYLPYLEKDGYFILSYSSNFSGIEKEGETVNHSKEELDQLVHRINAHYCGKQTFHYFGWLSQLKKWIERRLLGRNHKEYYYLFFKKIVS